MEKSRLRGLIGTLFSATGSLYSLLLDDLCGSWECFFSILARVPLVKRADTSIHLLGEYIKSLFKVSKNLVLVSLIMFVSYQHLSNRTDDLS